MKKLFYWVQNPVWENFLTPDTNAGNVPLDHHTAPMPLANAEDVKYIETRDVKDIVDCIIKNFKTK